MESEEKDTTEEVEEQVVKIKGHEDEPADEPEEQADSKGDDDGDVDEQKFASDATLKHGITPITSPLAALV